MTTEDDAYFDRRPPPFCPAFCPLRNLDRVEESCDLSCVNCGAVFRIGGTPREPHNCKWEVNLT